MDSVEHYGATASRTDTVKLHEIDEGQEAHAGAGLLEGFLRSVARAPERDALVVGARTWSYAALAYEASSWAAALHRKIGSQVQRVGVLSGRDEIGFIGTLAALWAGGAFVPLNRRFPARRTAKMVELAELDVLVYEDSDAALVAEICLLMNGQPRLVPRTQLDAANRGAPDRGAVPAQVESGEALAYLLFTSGSTGEPKGVPISHRNVCSFMQTSQAIYAIGPNDRLSQTFELTFDLSVFDMFMAWSHGAALCVLRPLELLAPAEAIERNGITVWFSVPSLAIGLMRRNKLREGQMPSLRLSLFCGEALTYGVARAWQRAAPCSRLENLYGPTELTIACARYPWADIGGVGDGEIVPLGTLYPGMEQVVVDAQGQLVARDKPGELCVRGPQMFSGYWRAPELDTARFVAVPPAQDAGGRFYRTGDIVSCAATGLLQYRGRADQQVKINGYRVELGDVESALRNAGCVEAVVYHEITEGGDQLLAVVTMAEGREVAEVLLDLRRRVPGYMVPSRVVHIATMPLNSNGKIDRKALRADVTQEAAGTPE
ncbi:non-ribosomal peptide synthetase [Xanthomonas bromi]|uniref:D-alanine--poly(Phosphoribitol) ligase n=1 Tax=Xanthomonas bromi TaxID=56449 RepID=A0A1C3NR51_9XANT|nr:amino acid adenylation domain-containing protein [Xanthomonas bromi]PPV05202.1 D-alanine--poly(phosphoribitol) ligase [Xanthomonas bromi]SBV52872.1 non-ribosomal peptide synthetase [Xanthomonas bromi]